jgi:hypothetical protein
MQNISLKLSVLLGLMLSMTSCLELDCCTHLTQSARVFLGSQDISRDGIELKVGNSVNLNLKISTVVGFLGENPVVYLYTSKTCKFIQDVSELQALQNSPDLTVQFAGNTVKPSDKLLPTQKTSRAGELIFSINGISPTVTPVYGDDSLLFIVGFTNPQVTPNIARFIQGCIGIEVI